MEKCTKLDDKIMLFMINIRGKRIISVKEILERQDELCLEEYSKRDHFKDGFDNSWKLTHPKRKGNPGIKQ